MRRLPTHTLRTVTPNAYDAAGLRALLAEACEAGVSDIHFKVPGRPRFRVNGNLVNTTHPGLRPEDTHRVAQTVLELAGQEMALSQVSDLSLGFGVQRLGRFRATIYRQRGSFGVAIHRMALTAPTLEQLSAPPGLADAVWGEPGITLVTGRTERLSALAALVDGYNRECAGQLLCLEQPLEYLHSDDQAAIAQREVGVDVPSFSEGLEVALVDDSDAIMLTDMPSPTAIEYALRLAEGGRPVVAGLAGAAPMHVRRHLIRRFPAHREREVAERLAATLLRVVWIEDGVLKSGFTGGR